MWPENTKQQELSGKTKGAGETSTHPVRGYAVYFRLMYANVFLLRYALIILDPARSQPASLADRALEALPSPNQRRHLPGRLEARRWPGVKCVCNYAGNGQFRVMTPL